ncbi:cytochrome-c oxidase, cbb3-type subunit III [Caenispirillum bisanense]|uniref:Cbb3-type cytochrome c oxidase subunit n=1 Tax=Caenispirillum bisanense TaxID=414052 RepID=A0A286G9C2_9PROT|nr:cytochrome-c oxidase, cbb3-type subunit III [Caenispirillum bisanense]SOD92110.1 cytochrome c oxidase cbb3-type subunit 3 [Caenispirillum bisanense]
MAGTPEKDAITGQHTTGHEWDGIRELNTPLPKWWVYVFWACVVFSVGYVVAYPAIPFTNSFSSGMLGYSSRAEVEVEMQQAALAHKDQIDAIAAKSLDEIAADPALRNYAMAGGQVVFKENCAPCHQSGGAGAFGFPTLADDEWIWGGTLDDIYTTLQHGIRWEGNADTRLSEMPAFGADGILEPAQIDAVANYVVSLASGAPQTGSDGAVLFEEQCAACHGFEGEGQTMLGAPALNNQLWLYAGDIEALKAQIYKPKHGVMPAWGGRLDDADIKQAAIYVHSLGGGQ